MRTKDEILKDVQAFCEYLPDKAWHVEHAKLEVFMDIRDVLADLTTTLEDIETALRLGNKA